MIRVSRRKWRLVGVAALGAALASGGLLEAAGKAGAMASPVSYGAAVKSVTSGPPTINKVLGTRLPPKSGD